MIHLQYIAMTAVSACTVTAVRCFQTLQTNGSKINRGSVAHRLHNVSNAITVAHPQSKHKNN